MKKFDSDEYFQAKQENKFQEYKFFPAEKYHTSESAPPPPETTTFKEVKNEYGESKKEENVPSDERKILRQYEKLTRSAPRSAIASPSPVPPPLSAGIGAGVSSVAVVAAAIAVAAGGLFSNFTADFSYTAGMDYLYITVNADDILNNYDKSYKLTSKDFYLEIPVDESVKTYPLQPGEHSYLITGLRPNKDYECKIKCNSAQLNENKPVYSQVLTTPAESDPLCICPENGITISYDEEKSAATISYSLYLSDYNDIYENATFFICDGTEDDSFSFDRVIYSDNTRTKDNYFQGSATSIDRDSIQLYVVGNIMPSDLDPTEPFILYSQKINLDLIRVPDEPIFSVDDLSVRLTPNEISIDGGFVNTEALSMPVDELYAFLTQYNETGDLISENTECSFSVDSGNNAFSLSSGACYGVKNYRFTLFSQNDEVVYESDLLSFTANQDFNAEYRKISPAEALIEYATDKVTVTVDPEFSSESDIYYYRLELKDQNGNVIDEYSGTGIAVFEITNLTGLDGFSFTYTDCGSFANRDVEYDSYDQENISFGIPKLTLNEPVGFNGTNFNIQYECDMSIYDKTQASLVLELVTESGETLVQETGEPDKRNSVELTELANRTGKVTVNALLTFKDNQAQPKTHTLRLDSRDYEFNYSFSVKQVTADLCSGSNSTIPIEFSFDISYLPVSYKISISDTANSINETFEPTELYYFNTVPIESDTEITIQILTDEDEIWGEAQSFSISGAGAKESFTSPYSESTNPYDSVVTFNEDGTINIYRYINFKTTNENVSVNAFIYHSYSEDQSLGKNTYEGFYDDIHNTDCEYSILENLPKQNYYFLYYTYYLYNGVRYTMAQTQPSGGICFEEEPPATATVTKTDEKMLVEINLTKSAESYERRILCDGREYKITEPITDNIMTLTFEKDVDVRSVTIFFNEFTINYDDFAEKLPLKGNKYEQITIETTTETI